MVSCKFAELYIYINYIHVFHHISIIEGIYLWDLFLNFMVDFPAVFEGLGLGMITSDFSSQLTSLWLCQQFAIENGPVEIVSFPTKNGGSFQLANC